jgi:protein KTI12
MALVTVSGFPSSGKSRRALQLKEQLENHIQDDAYQGPLSKVVILSDDTLNLARNVYDGVLCHGFSYANHS